MSLKDNQKQVDEWTSQFEPQYWPAHEQLARLIEEVGETAREINHLHGIKKRKPEEETGDLAVELGDIIFTIICIANNHNIDLDEAWKKVMEKYGVRDGDRYERKEV